MGGSEPLDGCVEDLAWIWQGSVVHDDTGGTRGDEDPFERLAVAVQILHIRADRLYPKATVAQFRASWSTVSLREMSVLRKPSRPKRRTTPASTPGPAPINREGAAEKHVHSILSKLRLSETEDDHRRAFTYFVAR
ncbi:MAG TPA: hypothetical protein VND98_00650 [Solirubrobacterales bacterium]|nr:hypothetical protein [Solirubrobacterales bacterium]